jgi:hypothetical protein
VPWRLIVVASVEILVSLGRSCLRRRIPRRGCIAGRVLLTAAARRELLHVLMLPDFDRAARIAA